MSESVASTLNGGTGIVGGAVGTAESTVGGVAGTAENAVSGGLSSMSDIPRFLVPLLIEFEDVKRQFGNLPATFQQTGTDVLAGLSGSMYPFTTIHAPKPFSNFLSRPKRHLRRP